MKQKTIKRLVDASGVLGFDFDNDDVMICWRVTPAEGRMLAICTIETEDGVWEEFFAIPYEDCAACDDLYLDIVQDFVDCYANDLYFGSAGSLALFSDVASKDDDGLIELLSFFGKTYDEFLLDVFFWFSCWLETTILLDEDDDDVDALDDEYDEEARATEHLVKSVLRHLGDDMLYVETSETEGVFWEFAHARGEIWYRRMDLELDEENAMIWYSEEFGHFPAEDPDALDALRDAVKGCFQDGDWMSYEVDGDPLAMLNLCLDELL